MDYAELQRQLAALPSYQEAMSRAHSTNISTHSEGVKDAEAIVRAREDIVKKYHAANQPAPSAPPPSSPAPAPAPAPTTVSYTQPPPPPPVKIPNRDVLNFSREEFSTSAITNLLFEQIGSTEIVNIARRDTIEGQNPYYSLISNLASIKREFDPTRLITKQKAVNANFAIYGIDLNNKIPDQEYLDRNNITSFFYIASNGDLVIELDNLEDDEIIDFEIANSGTINLVDEA